MMKFLSSLRINKTLLPQLLVVIAAFLTMIFLGSHFSSLAVNKYIGYYGDEIISVSAETVKNYLQGYEITLNDSAFFLERLRAQNSDADVMREELVMWFEWLHNHDDRFTEILSVYGIVDGAYITSSAWESQFGYTPELRVWYTGANAAGGKVFRSDPYVDAETGEYVVSFSKLLSDKEGRPFGVIALDVSIFVISNYISHIQFMDSGYGFLLDSDRRVIVHPIADFFGMQLENITEGSGHAEMAELLLAYGDVSAFNYISVTGEESVVFIRKLFNGWYIGLALPSDVYYKDVEVMRVILFITGLILALLLCGVLTFMHIAKNRSDSASQVKSSFLANMSHEIRTPMNAVTGMTELLLHEELTSRQRGYVNDIKASANSLLSLINDILDLSKIESGKLMLNPINYDFPALIDNINSMFKYVAQKKGLEFRFETKGTIPGILYGDDIRLRQVLTNLCGNAVKYTEKGYVRLKITSMEDKLIFEVRDTGMGIKKESIQVIFNAFEQDRTEKNRNTVGTGLGLSISKAFVEMMGGSIMLDSEYEQGTVITVIIPQVLGQEPAVKCEEKTETELTIYAPTASVLLVDDNEYNLKVAHGLLMLYGIDAKQVSSGKEAIDMVKKNDFDIVFIDHMMPDMDGVDATGEIRKLGGRNKTLPIIVLTANAVHGAKEMFLLNGFNDFISKPIDMHKLTEVLAEWLPGEKIMQKAGSADPSPSLSSGLFGEDSLLAKTGEINTEIGLSRVSGIESLYCENLCLFHKIIIPECERLSAFIKDNDINKFSISIHAIKSVLSSVGAMKLSEAAFQMETASKNNDLTYCAQQFPEFGERLLSLHKTLSVIFPKEETKEKENGTADYFREQIEKALTAAESYNDDFGLWAVNSLLAFDFGKENNALLEKVSAAFKGYDFDGAIETLKKLNA